MAVMSSAHIGDVMRCLPMPRTFALSVDRVRKETKHDKVREQDASPFRFCR